MRSPNKIISINIISKIKTLLIEDISVLENLNANKTPKSRVHQLVKSLIRAKKKILNLIPGAQMDIEPYGMPPTKMSISSLNKTNITEIRDQIKLPKILLEIEQKQMIYIQRAASGVGLPRGLQQTLLKILNKYIQITDQLDRSIKTNQLNAIVLT